MNSVNLIGRLVADPQVLMTRDDKKIAKFSLAVKRIDRYNANEVDFINCFTIGKNAENVEKFLRKGSQVGATGQIRTSKYMKNNETRYSFEIFLEKIYFISQKKESMTIKNEVKNDEYFNEFEQYDGIDLSSDDLPF